MSAGFGSDWTLNHVGYIVTHRDRTLRHLQGLGVGVSVGPQPLLPHEDGEGSLMYYQTLDGDPVTRTYRTGGAHDFRDGECQIGDCQLEVLAMKPGPGSFLSEYLERKGGGINHVCFNAVDVEADTRALREAGCDLVFNAAVNGRTVENYLDTRRRGDLMISLRGPASDWEKAWKANNEAHPLVPRWRLRAIGIGAQSAARSVEYYAALGFAETGEPVRDAALGVHRRAVQVGPLAFEFNEPVSDDSVYAARFAERGEGAAALVFEVDDLAAERARLTGRGATLLGASEDGTRLYLDTGAEGHLMLELRAAGPPA